MSFYRRYNGLQPGAMPVGAGAVVPGMVPTPTGAIQPAMQKTFAPVPVSAEGFKAPAMRAPLPFLTTDSRVTASLMPPGSLTLPPAPQGALVFAPPPKPAFSPVAPRMPLFTTPKIDAAATKVAALDDRVAKSQVLATQKARDAKAAVDTAKTMQIRATAQPHLTVPANTAAEDAQKAVDAARIAADKAKADKIKADAAARDHQQEVDDHVAQTNADAQAQADHDQRVAAAQHQAELDAQALAQHLLDLQAQADAKHKAELEALAKQQVQGGGDSGGGGGGGGGGGYYDDQYGPPGPGPGDILVDPTTGQVTLVKPSSGLLTAALSAVAGFFAFGPIGAVIGGGGGYYVAKKVIAKRASAAQAAVDAAFRPQGV